MIEKGCSDLMQILRYEVCQPHALVAVGVEVAVDPSRREKDARELANVLLTGESDFRRRAAPVNCRFGHTRRVDHAA